MPEYDILPRFYGRRRGKKLRPAASDLLETVLPAVTIAIPPAGRINPSDLFPCRPTRIWLEIGFGGGEHLAWQASQHPETGMIGCEVFRNGIASLLGQMQQLVTDNVRVFPEDARQLFNFLPNNCLDRVFLLFPDPWPKKRHIERRFINHNNLDLLAGLMKDEAEFLVATDDPVYKIWAIEQMNQRVDFINITKNSDQKPEEWPATRYEIKAKQAGRQPIFLHYRRSESPPL